MLGALIFRVAEALRAQYGSQVPRTGPGTCPLLRGAQRRTARGGAGARLHGLQPRPGVARAQAGNARTDSGIEIISPSPKRGTAVVTEQTLAVVARFTGGHGAAWHRRRRAVTGRWQWPVPVGSDGRGVQVRGIAPRARGQLRDARISGAEAAATSPTSRCSRRLPGGWR